MKTNVKRRKTRGRPWPIGHFSFLKMKHEVDAVEGGGGSRAGSWKLAAFHVATSD